MGLGLYAGVDDEDMLSGERLHSSHQCKGEYMVDDKFDLRCAF